MITQRRGTRLYVNAREVVTIDPAADENVDDIRAFVTRLTNAPGRSGTRLEAATKVAPPSYRSVLREPALAREVQSIGDNVNPGEITCGVVETQLDPDKKSIAATSLIKTIVVRPPK